MVSPENGFDFTEANKILMPRLSGNAFKLLLVIEDAIRTAGTIQVSISYAEIMSRTGIKGAPTVIRAIRELTGVKPAPANHVFGAKWISPRKSDRIIYCIKGGYGKEAHNTNTFALNYAFRVVAE